MDLTPYLDTAKEYLAKDIVIDGRVVPVKYVVGTAAAVVGLTALKVSILQTKPSNRTPPTSTYNFELDIL